MKTPNKKDLPTRDFFLVRKSSTRIQRVKVVDATPRYVVVRHGWGHVRERKTSLFHAYHEKFEMAKHWIELEVSKTLKEAEQAYIHAGKIYNEVKNLMEETTP